MSETICSACGERGRHFVPPSLGEEGFYLCQREMVTVPAVPAAAGSGETETPAFTLAHARAMREALYSAETLSRQYQLLAARLRTVEAERERLDRLADAAHELISYALDMGTDYTVRARDLDRLRAALASPPTPAEGEPE